MSAKDRILIARIGAIGDICMLMPLVRALSRRYHVHWLIHEAHKAVVRCFPAVECELIGVAPGPDEGQPFPAELVSTLREQDYSCFIDFSHWPSVAWLAAQLQNIPVRAVTLDRQQDALLGISVDAHAGGAYNCIVPAPSGLHQIEKWRMVVRAACGIDLQLDWPLPPLSRLPTDRPLRVFLHADAGKPEKVWPAARFAELLARLSKKRPVHCVINKVRRKTVRTLRWRLLFSAMTTEIAPLDPSFRRFRDLLFRTDLAIGCDSGPMHFASLLGVPTLVIYGRYPANEFAPLWRTEAVSPAAGMDPDTVAVAAVEAALGRLIDRLQHAPMDLDETNRA